MDTQTQIDRLIELAIIQRSELKQLVEQLPQLREHLNAEVEKVFDETEPQLRAELEEWTTKQTADKTAALGVALEAKIADLAKSLEVSTQARYNAIIAERAENERLAAEAEAKIAEHAASLPSAVKEIVSAELARFPRAGEIDQLRKEFAEPRGLNPRGKWQAGETYNKLDLVTINGDSYTSNTDGNRTRPSRSSADWTLVAARGTGGGGGPTSLSELTTVPSDGDVLIGSGTSWVTSNLTAGAGISITVGPGAITISATDGDITLDDGTAASPSLHFTNDADTGIYRPSANTLGISTSGVQRMYVDQNGITTVGAGATFDGSVHAANGNANNPSFSFTSDQDTGFYRHGTNELGISIGGTEKAVMTSTTFSITPNVSTSGNLTVSGTVSSGVVTSSFADALSSFTRTGLNGAGAAGVLAIATDGKTAGDAIAVAIQGKDSANNAQTYGQIKATIVSPTSTSESSSFAIQTVTAGSLADAAVFSQSAATLSGNLTVSNLITSAASSALVLRGDNATGGILTLNVAGTSTADFTQGNGRVVTTNTNSPEFRASRSSVIAALGVDATGGYVGTLTAAKSLSLYANGTVAATLSATNGNLLVGTTTDSGNGKLQLATHTTSAGGIGFGTDISVYRKSAAVLGCNGVADLFLETAGAGLWLGSAAGTYQVGINRSSNNLVFWTGSFTTALTLDSSQNATFAGNALISHATGNNSKLSVIKNTAPALNHVAQVVLGQGVGGGFGANDRTYQLVNNGESSTAAYFGIQYWDGSNYNLRLKIDSTGNTTLAGNLTVSGTGTSSFGGKIQSSAATATGYNQLYDTTGITTGRGAFAITSTGAGLALGIEASVGGTSFTGSTAYASYFGTTTATPIHFVTNAAISATLTSGGNLLIGTTTDGGQKLQVSGSGFISGSLAVGDRAAPAGVSLRVQQAGSDDVGLEWQRTSATNGILLSYNRASSAYTSMSYGASSHTFTISGTTALTLDSSQNATFAGTARINGGVAYLASNSDIDLQFTKANLDKRWRFVVTGTESGSNAGSNMNFYTYSDAGAFLGTPLSINRSTGDATFSGAIAIGNTVNTVSPTSPNRTITMVIGGTTYYIHAKTTND